MKSLLFVILGALGIWFSTGRMISRGQMVAKDLVPPPPNLEQFSMGFKAQMADSLWVRAIQDFDYCEQQIARAICRNNTWLFHMLDAVTNLDPQFRMPYSMGGVALSIVVGDVKGAAQIFDKADVEFPTDWKIMYRGGYHALLEEKDNVKAAKRFEAAARNGAPQWLLGLSGRLYSEAGREEAAERLLEELSSNEADRWIADRLKQKIAEQKAEQEASKNLKK